MQSYNSSWRVSLRTPFLFWRQVYFYDHVWPLLVNYVETLLARSLSGTLAFWLRALHYWEQTHFLLTFFYWFEIAVQLQLLKLGTHWPFFNTNNSGQFTTPFILRSESLWDCFGRIRSALEAMLDWAACLVEVATLSIQSFFSFSQLHRVVEAVICLMLLVVVWLERNFADFGVVAGESLLQIMSAPLRTTFPRQFWSSHFFWFVVWVLRFKRLF